MESILSRCERQGDCLIWTLSCVGQRHPQVRIGGKTRSVRQVLAEAEGMEVGDRRIRMTCSREKCVEPRHFRFLTHQQLCQENARDGRLSLPARSKAAARAKRAVSNLTPEDVRTIYASKEPYRVLAERYGKSLSLIKRIKLRQVWRDVLVTVCPSGKDTRYTPTAVEPMFSALGPGRYFGGGWAERVYR